ncbi:M23 family metallopeptidase [uncultured Pseudokineococcus sp.]|uniref:M23 family metallopeptidase n=1 Tax=uncultured Pseudokineococcus sp. TaxID=1642928 RepID=UPI002623AD42|nr:M23 family metallopeptidase [uncultured Pseudokineococcus sp.]
MVSAAVVVSLATGAPPVAAAPDAAGQAPQAQKEAVDTALDALQDDLVGTSQELTSAYAEYAAVQEQLPGAQQAADLAAQVQAKAQAAADDLANRLSASRTAQEAAAASVADSEESMSDSSAAIGRLAAESYRSSGTPKTLSMAMGSEDSADFASKTAAISGVSAAEGDLLASAESDRAVRSSATSRLGAVSEQVADLEAQARAQLDIAEQAAADAQARQAEIEALMSRQQAAVATIESRQAEEQARLDQLQAESDDLGDQLRAIAEADQARAAAQAAEAAEAAAQSSAPAQSGASAQQGGSSRAPSAVNRSSGRDSGTTLRRPEGRVSSPYGMRMHPIRGYMRMHSGVDLASGCGTPIRAAEDGEIVSAGYNGSYGNITVVNHGLINGESVATAYPHMSGFTKTSGSVTRGEILGYEGETGAVTGCHLHFEVRVNGEAVDPMGWI